MLTLINAVYLKMYKIRHLIISPYTGSYPMKKSILAVLLASMVALTGCQSNPTTSSFDDMMPVNEVKFASFNVSFARDGDATENYQRWVRYFQLTPEQQDSLIALWKNDTATEEEHLLAERVIQIRNIAAIIQRNRPDVLLLTEFNNDGTGTDMTALQGFQDNYLGVAQSLNSVDGGDMLEPIHYPFVHNYATNTGLLPDDPTLDFGNDGGKRPNGAHGFGFYHGHYGFALMSKFKVDTANTRTFQKLKWAAMPGETVPTIPSADDPDHPCKAEDLPAGMACGDPWYTDAEWQTIRLSSKNHVDAPIIIPTARGNKVIHALMSHPTPAAFDPIARHNHYRNGAENKLWVSYLNNESWLIDDKGNSGGFTGTNFVIMGDLNADPAFSDSKDYGIRDLMDHPKVNHEVSHSTGSFVPTSEGARKEDNTQGHPYPQTRTSTFGTRVDYAVPSTSLEVVNTGVYWQAEGQPGRLLFNDPRVGERGSDKEVSSDHRFVWVTVKVD